MHRAPHSSYRYTQAWLILAGLQVFAVFLLQQYGLLGTLIVADSTYLSLVILSCYVGFWLYGAVRSVYLDQQHLDLDRQLQGHAPAPHSLSGRYAANSQKAHNHKAQQSLQQAANSVSNTKLEPNALLVEVLVDDSHRGHELGWYICSLLIKAGMVGTVIGFVLMLQSVSGLQSFDITQMQELLITMSAGMGVALYTTLTGVVCSALLGYQYLQLDRAADALVIRTIEAVETGALRP